MKKILFALATIGLVAIACAAFAQGAFVDVPTDHWAYDAVNQLQRVGIIVGYPDGTFGGKRAMTRYEFAVAIARLLPLLNGDTVINNDVDLSGYAKKSDIPAFSGASKGDLDALRKLVNEFGDELASLGVDVDALKRDVANLTARVEALEAENRRVRFTGNFDVIALTGSGDADDMDGQTVAHKLLDDVKVLKNFDLNIVGRASDKVTVYSTINYGDYLNYYASGLDMDDAFYPTLLYAVADMGKTTLTAGRFPMQWTPLTMMRADADSYGDLDFTDGGDYYFDGIKADMAFGKAFGLTMFAAKNDQNRYGFDAFNDSWYMGTLPFTQTAGARATFDLGSFNLGASYYQSWDSTIGAPGVDKLKVFGVDAGLKLGSHFGLGGEWATSKLYGNSAMNDAWTADLTGEWDSFSFTAGYKDIGLNFFSAGDWMGFSKYENLTGIKGWCGEVEWGLSDSLTLSGGIQSYKDKFGLGLKPKNVTGGIEYTFGGGDTLGATYDTYKINGMYKDTFTTIAYNHKFNPQANLRLAYQFITNDNLAGYKENGARALAQFSVSF
ncbi:MAG: S-layer homology domain-containing protein [Abditibacteriota bacterium]|nr:S-layer homology domain-containing protein [Abditibacteriota bacterium]